MDPLSVTLAVVSLTTAVKDIVEVGHKIHKSFAKVSDNFRSAKRVAEEIKEMVEEMEAFCKDHKDALDNMKDFTFALQGLLGKFRNFETTILPLFSQTGGRKWKHFIRGWDAWRNNNRIERSILDLQTDILKVMRRYMWKSAMRTEVKLEAIHRDTSRGLTGINQGLEALEVVQRDISIIRTMAPTAVPHSSHESSASGTTGDEFDRSVIMFAQSTPSTSSPLLRTPNLIPEEVMTTAYIKFQVNNIVMTLETISKSPSSPPNRIAPTSITSDAVRKFEWELMTEQSAMSISRLRHYVVRQVTVIRDLLDIEGVETISIHEGARALTDLMIGLQALNMGHECILVGNWAITLSRELVVASGDEQPDLCAYLALDLLNQSIGYHCSDDPTRSLQTITEAYTITQSLHSQSRGEVNFQILHSSVLLQYSELVDTQRSIEMIVEAVRVLENILNVEAFTLSESLDKITIEQVVLADPSFLDHLFASDPPTTAIVKYARALQRLGAHVFIDGNPAIALALELLAVAVRRKMVAVHGDGHKVELARALSWLVYSEAASQIPTDELAIMADECAILLRELARKNPIRYAQQLVSVLWKLASTLQLLDRDTEAIAIWEEVAILAGQIIRCSETCATALRNLSDQLRRLKRYDDAARTETQAINAYRDGAETQAVRYFHLSTDLQQLQRYQESAQAARTSVGLYQRLAMREPERWMIPLIEGHSNLAHCLAASGDYKEALTAWKESVFMLDNCLTTNTDANWAEPGQYLGSLRIHAYMSFVVEDEEKCLQVCSTAVRLLRQLSELFPQDAEMLWQLWWTDLCYAYNLFRLGRLQDAQQYVDHWFDEWRNKPVVIPESDIMGWHATMSNLLANILDMQSFTEQALITSQKAHDILRLSASVSQPPCSEMIELMVLEARMQIELGNNEDAVRLAKEALCLSRPNSKELESNVGNLLLSLLTFGFASLSCHDYKRALEAAREGCDILMTREGLEYWQNNEYCSSICPNLFSLLALAEANLGSCSDALQNVHRAVDFSLDIRKMKLYVSATTAELSYMNARNNLADIVLANGDFSQAREICEEGRLYFSKRVENRMGDYRDLAPILRILGVLCCSAGHHDEGDDAAKELSRIMKMLGKTFPSLQKQVKRRLRHQAEVRALQVLSEISQKLECEHQAGVTSLFEE